MTPYGNLFCVPNEALAVAVAGEWASQEERIKPALMPLMTLCTTAIDIVPLTRDKVVNDIVKFLGTDTVCFFADAQKEPGLREMQEEMFLPIIAWFENRFGVKVWGMLLRASFSTHALAFFCCCFAAVANESRYRGLRGSHFVHSA